MPVAVNVYILSVEYERDSELASQTIFATTLISALTLTVWLLLVKAA
jgi:predicted permease